jgi:hypothetical protein
MNNSDVKSFQQHLLLAALTLLVLLSMPVFVSRVIDCFVHPEQQNTTDMTIFAGAAKHFLATGNLYVRSDNYAHTYAPGAGVYKFPPAYQLTVLPLLKLFPAEFSFLLAERMLYLALYLIASILVVLRAGREWIWRERSPFATECRGDALLFLLCAALVTLWSMGFFECFSGIEPETLVFFFMALCLYFHARHDLLSGLALGVAVTIKLYPLLMLFAFIFPLRARALGGFMLGIAAVTVLSIAMVGIGEHYFYVEHVLPVLLHETPIYHIQNKTVEAFFNALNLIPAMTGTITSFVRNLTLLSLLGLGVWAVRVKPRPSFFYVLACTLAPLLCLANFWQQYHILLALPLLSLLAYAIRERSLLLCLLLVAVIAATSIQEAWYQDLVHHTLASVRGQRMLAYQIAHPLINVPLLFFPHLWLLARLRDFVFLTPLVLYFITAALLVMERNAADREHAA